MPSYRTRPSATLGAALAPVSDRIDPRFGRGGLRHLLVATILGTLAACGGGGGGGGGGGVPPIPTGLTHLHAVTDSDGRAAFTLPQGPASIVLIDSETGAPLVGADLFISADDTQAFVTNRAPGYVPLFRTLHVESMLDASPLATASTTSPSSGSTVLAAASIATDRSTEGLYADGEAPVGVVEERLRDEFELVRSNVSAAELRMAMYLETAKFFDPLSDVKDLARDLITSEGLSIGAMRYGFMVPIHKGYQILDGSVNGLTLVGKAVDLLGVIGGKIMGLIGGDDATYDIYRWNGVAPWFAPVVVRPHGAIPSALIGEGRIAGVIRSSGVALAGASVNISSEEDSLFASRWTTTDASGAYSFGGLPDGRYVLRARAPEHLSERDDSVVVEGGGLTSRDFALFDLTDASLAVDQSTVYVKPGSTSGFTFGVWNRGALQDLAWNVVGVPAWLILSSAGGILGSKEFLPLSASVASWASGTVRLTFQSSTTGQTVDVEVIVMGSGLADLVVEDVAVDPTAGARGSTATVSATIVNRGTGAAGPSVSRIRIAQASTATTADPLLASITVDGLSPGARRSFVRAVTIPSNAAVGGHYLVVTANASAAFEESNSANNQASVSFGVDSTPPVLPTTYSISPTTTTVGEGAGTKTFTITRSGATPSETLYVSTAVTEGHANAGDYTPKVDESLTFASGDTSKTVSVAILNDTASEGTEKFGLIVQRSTADPASTYLLKATFTITDDDSSSTTYTISPTSTTVGEGVGSKSFTITRSGSTPTETLYVSTTVTEGSSNSGDYTQKVNESLTFTSGETSKSVSVSITDDTKSESTETFGLIVQRNSTDAASTYLVKATFTITDDDSSTTTYSISPSSTTVAEGVGSKSFTITRSGATPAETLYVSTTVTEGYSNSGDYTQKVNESLSFTSGLTSKTVTVSITDDTKSEGTEKFGLIVQRNSTDSASTYLVKATFTITDDDSSTTTYSISPTSTTVNESVGTKTFTITRSGATPAETLYVSTTVSEGSANSSDYTKKLNESLTFTSGLTSKTVTVTITNDSTKESTETFGLIVQRNSTDSASTYLVKATFTITDDD